MAILSISSGVCKVNDGAYSGALQEMHVGDTFGIKFTLKNNGSKTIPYWMLSLSFMTSSGSFIKIRTTTPNWGSIAAGKSKTVSIEGLDCEYFGLVKGKVSNTFRLRVVGLMDPDGFTDYGETWVEVVDMLRFVGEQHKPRIEQFSVARNGNESTQLVIKAYGTRSSHSSTYAEKVKFEYIRENESTWTAVPSADTITVSRLLAGVGITSPAYLSMQLPLGTACQFRLTFYNDLGEQAQAVRYVGRAFANIHLRGSQDGGVALGMFCSTGEARFECAYPAYFYAGIRRYNVGDKINITSGRALADVTNSAKNLSVTIPIEGASGIKAARVNKFFANICNAGGYCATSASVDGGTDYASLSGVTPEVYPVPGMSAMIVYINRPSKAYTATNNAPAICRCIDIEIEITEVE